MYKKFTEIKAPAKYLPGEQFTRLKVYSRYDYLISTKGRIYSYARDRFLNGTVKNGVLTFEYSPTDGKIPFRYARQEANMKPQRNGKTCITFQRLVAHTFLIKPKGNGVVIHLDYDKLNNSITNLMWVPLNQQVINSIGSPRYKDYKIHRQMGKKLTHTEVLQIKELLEGKRKGTIDIRIADIAQKFNIASMNVYRIQNGDLWGNLGKVVKKKIKPLKFNTKQIKAIRQLAKKGTTGVMIAQKYNVSPTTICRIIKGKYYVTN